MNVQVTCQSCCSHWRKKKAVILFNWKKPKNWSHQFTSSIKKEKWELCRNDSSWSRLSDRSVFCCVLAASQVNFLLFVKKNFSWQPAVLLKQSQNVIRSSKWWLKECREVLMESSVTGRCFTRRWEQQELSLNWFLSTVNSKAITRVNCARLDATVPPR